MGPIIENWDEIEKEFELWDKTIKRCSAVAYGSLFLGVVMFVIMLLVTKSALSILLFPILAFIGLVYDIVVGNYKIKAHVDKITMLSGRM